MLKPVIEFVFRLSEFIQSSGAGDQRAGDGPADRVRELCSLRRSVDSKRQERYVNVLFDCVQTADLNKDGRRFTTSSLCVKIKPNELSPCGQEGELWHSPPFPGLSCQS